MSQMLPPDIAAALGGGGGAPPAGGGGLPPDLAALLGGGGGAGAPGPDADQGQDQDVGDLLSQAIDLLSQAKDAEQEPEDQAVIAQCILNLHKLQAKDQAEADSMVQGKASPRGVRKAARAQGYGG
jgi:hypothetical protein